MSGITGLYFRDGRPVDRPDLERMTERLLRRGPDGSGVWHMGPAGLGHRMLWTTPESLREALPLTLAHGELAITADVRLDNRDELIRLLGLTAHPSAEIGDGELILRAYRKWGEACPTRLLGDFAFAIWDGYRQQLFCARDHMGVKPFVYYLSDRLFAFASEVKALLALPQVPCRINEARIADYLVPELEGIDKTVTFYQEIFRLPPAHIAIITQERSIFRSYWSLDPTREIHYNSDQAYTEAFREIFTEAVRCRLRSHVSAASMLSGGMDSSSIVGVARRLLSQDGTGPLLTFSAVSEDDANCPETRSIKAVLNQGEVKAHLIQANRISHFHRDLKFLHEYTDDPFDNIMTLPQVMYIVARKEGVKILLDGIDGDVVTSQGTPYLTYLLRAGKWTTAVTEAIGHSQHFYSSYYSPWKLLCQNSKVAFIPANLRRYWRRLFRRNSSIYNNKDIIINRDFAQCIGLADRLESLYRHGYFTFSGTLREYHFNVLNHPYLTVALERYDRVASTYSIEPRHPLLDKHLVEFCLSLPWQQKIRQGWSKIILRRAMAGILPEEVRWRRDSTHLDWQFKNAFITLEPKLFERMCLSTSKDIGKYVNTSLIDQICKRYFSQGAMRDGYKVWETVTLALWLYRQQIALR